MTPTLWYTLATGNNPVFHLQAQLLCVSLLAHRSEQSQIAVYTDHPEIYGWLAARGHVSIRPMDMQAFNAQKNPPHPAPEYYFRARAGWVASVAQATPGPSVYLDSDMVARDALAPLENLLAAGRLLMHKEEDRYSDQDTRAERTYWAFLRHNPLRRFGVEITEASRMWNAGLIGASPADAPAMKKSVDIIDAMTAAGIGLYTREQVAYSVLMESHGRLSPADPAIEHYWANKDGWRPFLETAALTFLAQGGDVEAAVAWYRSLAPGDFPPERAPRPNRAERWKKKIRKKLGLLAPSEK